MRISASQLSVFERVYLWLARRRVKALKDDGSMRNEAVSDPNLDDI
jgi:hypothetical protein